MSSDIVDPIHGFISVSDSELHIVDDPIFQRLRRINQLSGANLVYPGARHTRFEHSLGTMHISGMAASSLCQRGFLRDSQVPDIRMAGLVHDIGHGPFSHLFETVMRNHGALHGADHEGIGRQILEHTSLGDTLGRSRRKIADLAFGASSRSAISDIVSGVMGADTMDYLLRDGHFTGSEHAHIDHRRLVSSIEIRSNALALEQSAIHSFESMMHSRRQMFHTVYFHRAVRAAQILILEAFELAATELGLDSLDLGEYVTMTDESILSQLVALGGRTPEVRTAQRLVSEFQQRRLPKCVLDVPLKSKVNAAEIRTRIASKAHVPESDVLVDVPGVSSLPLSSDNTEIRAISLVSGPKSSRSVKSVSLSKLPLVAALLEPISMLRVYSRGNTKKVMDAAARVSI